MLQINYYSYVWSKQLIPRQYSTCLSCHIQYSLNSLTILLQCLHLLVIEYSLAWLSLRMNCCEQTLNNMLSAIFKRGFNRLRRFSRGGGAKACWLSLATCPNTAVSARHYNNNLKQRSVRHLKMISLSNTYKWKLRLQPLCCWLLQFIAAQLGILPNVNRVPIWPTIDLSFRVAMRYPVFI